MAEAGFNQAAIRVQRELEFAELKQAIDKALTRPAVERFLKDLKKKGIGIRDFDAVLANEVIEHASEAEKAASTARGLYDSLTLSDQGLIREFYLERLEHVDVELRAKYAQVYRVF